MTWKKKKKKDLGEYIFNLNKPWRSSYNTKKECNHLCRYSYDDNFIGKVDTNIDVHYNNVDDVIDTEQFNKELAKLMKKIRSEALKPENGGLGKGQTKLTPFITLYTLVQCTQDLSPISCAQCLAIAETNFVTYCANKRGCRIFYSSCFARYEFYPFFYPVSSAPELSNNTQKKAVVHP